MCGSSEWNISACPYCHSETDMNKRTGDKDEKKAKEIVRSMLKYDEVENYRIELCDVCRAELEG